MACMSDNSCSSMDDSPSLTETIDLTMTDNKNVSRMCVLYLL
jgi:hypothetical protein